MTLLPHKTANKSPLFPPSLSPAKRKTLNQVFITSEPATMTVI